ncbi:MAG TPA: outer membrane protein assembly factor BamA [Xanthobacteraceae bacterium]|jgi:outer membrane protein insertion porin family|nr:outer membrane protein assembly factor BamA [Xanthobacteraceae bacterium]
MRCRGIAFILAGFVALAAGVGSAAADPLDSSITVIGNRHAGADMVRSYFHAGAGGKLDAQATDDAIKRLYATGLFSNVKISRAGDRILVIVVENPTIGRLAVEGNHKIKDEDLKKDLQSKPGGPLSRANIQSDVVRMLDLYKHSGYFDAQIVPKIIEPKPGSNITAVDLVFEVKEGAKLAVRRVIFTGNKAFSETKLRAVIKTGVTNVVSFLLNNDTYDADKIENDRDLLRQFYRDHGYADARISSDGSYDAATKSVTVTFKIDEGSQYRLGAVGLNSNLKSVDPASLTSALRMQAGDTYDAAAVDKTAEDLSIQLAKNGEPFADVVPHVERKPGRQVIDIVYTVQNGKRLYIERIDIHGNIKTHDEVIRREFDFGEGDAYNRALVDRGERHLKQLGYFKNVNITTKPGSAPDRVVLDVAVEEQQTGNFFVSGGYSSQDGWLGSITVSDTNFLGTGDIAKVSTIYGQYARGVDVSFTDPWFLDQRLSAGIDLFGKQTFANTNQDFNTELYGGKVVFGTPINENLSVSTNYSLYKQGLSLDPSVGTASLPIQQAAQMGSYWVSSIGNGVTYSTLDNRRNPTEGVWATVNNDVAGLGGAAKFARTTQDVRYYHELGGDVVGMVRGQGGYVAPWGGQQLPLLDGFFGGPQLVRGFAPNGFGPRDITPGTTMDNLGGNAYWTTSAELQAPVPFIPQDAGLKVAAFTDVGSLWATSASSATTIAALSPSQQIANSSAIRSSIGAGLIWDSMFGPIRVDYAYPLTKQPYDVTQRFQFTAGGF